MRFPIKYTILLFITFVLLLYIFSFYYNFNIKKFIGRVNYNLYLSSTILCILCFLIFYGYILIKTDFTLYTINHIFYNILIMIISTTLWIMSSYYNIKLLNIFFIVIICIANYNLLNTIINCDEEKMILFKKICIIMLMYLLFHHVFIDLFLWNYYKFIDK